MSEKVLMVLTREAAFGSQSGREKTIFSIYSCVAQHAEIKVFRLNSIVEQPSFRRLLFLVFQVLRRLLHGRFTPIQVALFCDYAAENDLVQFVRDYQPDSIYFDSVRAFWALLAIKRKCACSRLVCDFDDLMSRRFKELYDGRHGMSLGYLASYFPRWLIRNFLNGMLARVAQSYEQRTLAQVEGEIALIADAVTLVSRADADELRSRDGAASENIVTIPPAVSIAKRSIEAVATRRFVFIGSDALLQNRLTIDFLLDLWHTFKPSFRLDVYGKMHRDYNPIDNVSFHGRVELLDEVYTPGSVALCPSFLRGGIKTKVLEALSFGILPVGTKITFEGFPGEAESLALPIDEFKNLIRSPDLYSDKLYCRLNIALDICSDYFSPARVSRLWQEALAIG